MFGRELLDRLSAETGFRADTLERVLRLERLLDAIRRHPFLGPRLALKGGTALNLFFGDRAPRLSVDLDFNYVGSPDRETTVREKPELERALAALATGQGYRLQWGREGHAGRSIYMRYRNALGTEDHIEIDVNFLYRIPLVDVVERDAWAPDPAYPCRALLVGTEEIIAGKLLALLDRGAPRDVYDAALVASGHWPHDQELLRRLLIVLSGVLDRSLLTYPVPHRPTLTAREIEESLRPMLRLDESPVLDELTATIRPLMARLVALSDGERAYVEGIQWGEFRPELVLGADTVLLDKVQQHPALLWKVDNGRLRERR
jgi:predicted nucleotidyltransferase component of viral defense system